MISINPYVILMQIINFSILVFLLKKYLVAPLSAQIDSRAEKIQNNLKTASNKLENAESLEKERNEQLKNAYHEAKTIREKAQEAAQKEQDRVVGEAKKEAQRVLENSKKEIEAEFVSAEKLLKNQIGSLAIGLSSKIMKKNIDQGAQENLIKEFLSTSQN